MKKDQKTQSAVLKTLLVSDMVDSTKLTEQIGDERMAEIFRDHDRLARDLLREHEGREADRTDGFLLLFERPINAVQYALEFHQAMGRLSEEAGVDLGFRIGIHLGEVVLIETPAKDVARGAKPLEVEGLAKLMAARLMALAGEGQTLLSRGAFDLARRGAVGSLPTSEHWTWLAHGEYLLKGVTKMVEVFEVGLEGRAPLEAPANTDKVQRAVEQKTVLGWRPAPGLELPHRSHWVMDSRLDDGGASEIWLATHKKTRDRRIFKFCYEVRNLRSLQREITLFRLLKDELGDRDDITRILDWNFDNPPFFIESEYTAGGSLLEWAEEQGGIGEVPRETRLEIVAQVADALAAAHSVGVLHKDVKPANVLITSDLKGRPRAQLTDFGVGRIVDRERLEAAGITALGITDLTAPTGSSHSGTRLYMAPEQVEGRAATLQADIYSLGVMLYQLTIGDFSRAVAPGWERDVDDELLCEDIAAAVDGSPSQRLSDARQLGERLRSLEIRREKRAAEQREREEAKRAMASLARSRQRRMVVAAVIGVLIVFGAVVFNLWRKAGREAERANREAQTAEEVTDFLETLFSEADPYEAQGPDTTLREVLDRGARRIEKDLTGQPVVQARFMNVIGGVYRHLGLYDAAEPLIKAALRKRQDVHGKHHQEVAESLNSLAELLHDKGDYKNAETRYHEALEMRRDLLADNHPDVAESLDSLGVFLHDMEDYDGAEARYVDALRIRRQWYGEKHRKVALSLNNLAGLQESKGDLEAAVRNYKDALGILPSASPLKATILSNLGLLYYNTGEYDSAEPLYNAALKMRQDLLGDEHSDVAVSKINIAALLKKKEKYDDAETLLLDALRKLRRRIKGDHRYIADGLRHLANVLTNKNDYDGAEEYYRMAQEMHLRLSMERHTTYVENLHGWGLALFYKRDLDAAVDKLRKALDVALEIGMDYSDIEESLTYVLEQKADGESAADL